MKDKKFPSIAEKVFVWPRHRTVRDEQRKPVAGTDGTVQKKPAHVRDGAGALITGRKFVKVDLHILSLIQGGNLEWCSCEDHRKHLIEKTRKAASERKTDKKDDSVKPVVSRKDRQQQAASDSSEQTST